MKTHTPLLNETVLLNNDRTLPISETSLVPFRHHVDSVLRDINH